MKQVRITKRIIDYGEDHHPAYVIAHAGEILYLHRLFDEGYALLSHSNDPAEQQFYAEADEFEAIESGEA